SVLPFPGTYCRLRSFQLEHVRGSAEPGVRTLRGAGGVRVSQVDFRTRRFSAPQARVQEFTGDVLQHVEPSRALRVLDIGCGSGEQVIDLATALPQARFVGVDISPANISA